MRRDHNNERRRKQKRHARAIATARVAFRRARLPSRVVLPYGVEFSQLGVTRSADGKINFQLAPLVLFCQRNGFDPVAIVESDEGPGRIAGIWYFAHRLLGGAEDPLVEHMLDGFGQVITLLMRAAPPAVLREMIRVEREAA